MKRGSVDGEHKWWGCDSGFNTNKNRKGMVRMILKRVSSVVFVEIDGLMDCYMDWWVWDVFILPPKWIVCLPSSRKEEKKIKPKQRHLGKDTSGNTTQYDHQRKIPFNPVWYPKLEYFSPCDMFSPTTKTRLIRTTNTKLQKQNNIKRTNISHYTSCTIIHNP